MTCSSASAEIVRASRALKTVFTPDKINVGALGNMVPQLHIHVIARFADDPAWPQPVWGVVPALPYTADALESPADVSCGTHSGRRDTRSARYPC